MDADAIVRFIWNDEATRPSREAFAKLYDYMQAHPDPLPEGVVRKSSSMETRAQLVTLEPEEHRERLSHDEWDKGTV